MNWPARSAGRLRRSLPARRRPRVLWACSVLPATASERVWRLAGSRIVSASPISRPTPQDGSLRYAWLRLSVSQAPVAVGRLGAAETDLAGEAGEEALGCGGRSRGRDLCRGLGGRRRRARRCCDDGLVASRRVRRIDGARGMVPGARDTASSDRPWPSPPSDSPVLPSGTWAANTLFMPPSMPVLSLATGVPLAISLAISACLSAAVSARTASAISSGIT